MAGGGRILLLRHGETTAGPGVMLGCREDPGLSVRGLAQARRAGRRLAHHRPLTVVTSPLRRARETAEAAFPAAPIEVDERLAEVDLGALSGLSWIEAKREHRDLARSWRQDGRTPRGEELKDVLRRAAAAALDALATAARPVDGMGSEVVLVTHSTPIRALVLGARGQALDRWRSVRVDHAAIRVVRAAAITVALS